jgi:hypothetical protein
VVVEEDPNDGVRVVVGVLREDVWLVTPGLCCCGEMVSPLVVVLGGVLAARGPPPTLVKNEPPLELGPTGLAECGGAVVVLVSAGERALGFVCA